MIIDTDVIIWYLRGNRKAQQVINDNLPFSISAITYMELVQGMKDKKELQTFLGQINSWSVDILHIDEDISIRAMFYVEEFFLSHSMELADAIIGATAVKHGETLLTANSKHYKHLPNVQLKIFKP